MVILTNPYGNEIKTLKFKKLDVDLNDTRDFDLTILTGDWDNSMQYGARVFVPGTEFGGVIGKKKIDTEENEIMLSGYCWRGVLNSKVIEPPAGQDYKTVSGELNEVVAELIAEADFDGLFSVSAKNTNVTVTNYQFDRYITLLEGIEKMLQTKGYKLSIVYTQREGGAPGYVTLSATEIKDYSKQIELSQDNRLGFIFSETQNGVNHLICLGKGELKDRLVVHLYADSEGNISETKYYSGLEEVVDTYENNSIETKDEMIEPGTEQLKKLMNMQSFDMDIEALGIEVDIGDVIGGKDYITGMSLAKPISNKIYTEEAGKIKKQYKVEGEK